MLYKWEPRLRTLLRRVLQRATCLGPKLTVWPVKQQLGIALELSFVVGECLWAGGPCCSLRAAQPTLCCSPWSVQPLCRTSGDKSMMTAAHHACRVYACLLVWA